MDSDTIVACATPPGVGAVAVVRLSGPRAIATAGALVGRDVGGWPSRSARLCSLRGPGPSAEVLDKGLITLFRAPASYTGEDMVEVTTHGGRYVPESVVEACVALGARRARPGEFTQRAYLNGKLDLTQAEAVGDLTTAASEQGRSVALHQLERGLGERVASLRSRLIGLSALLVQHIDFPEEDEAPVSLQSVASEAQGVARDVARLLATAPAGKLLREGALTVLAGPPNAGKSSLFNALLGIERAIVTPTAGTTRDAVEAVASIDGFPFRLVDTAGLRAGTEGVEQLGIEVAHRYLEGADVVIVCRETVGQEAGDVAGSPTTVGPTTGDTTTSDKATAPESPEPTPALVGAEAAAKVFLRTKWDLAGEDQAPRPGEIPVSVRTGQGIAELKQALRDLAFRGVVERRDEVPVVTTRRQAELLKVAEGELSGFADALEQGVPPEAASAHIRSAESALEDVLGVVASDDVLDRVFKDFCIGK